MTYSLWVTCLNLYSNLLKILWRYLLLHPVGFPGRFWKRTHLAIFHAILLEYWVKQKSVTGRFIQRDAKGVKKIPLPVWSSLAPPPLWQYISESARTEDFPPGQEAVGTGPAWLRWMCAAGIRQKLPVAALLQFPSPAWQLSISLLPLPVNYTNADWQAACPSPIGKATQRTCSNDITAGPHTGSTGGVCLVAARRWWTGAWTHTCAHKPCTHLHLNLCLSPLNIKSAPPSNASQKWTLLKARSMGDGSRA